MTPGARFRSQVCTTEVIVIRAPDGAADTVLHCGGHPMVEPDAAATPGLEPAPDLRGGSLLGKRYTDESGDLELLVTKAGEGTLSVPAGPLTTLQAKQLPSSD